MRMRETAGRKCDRGSKYGVTNLTRSSVLKRKRYAFGYFRADFLDCFRISYSPAPGAHHLSALKSRHRIFVKPQKFFH